MQIVECELTISEGRDRALVRRIRRAVTDTPGCELAYSDSYRRKNYSEISFFGEPEAILNGAYQAIVIAAEAIDMRDHSRDPSRIGAVDFVRFSPISGLGLQECAVLSQRLGSWAAQKLDMPVYFYGTDVDGRELRTLNEARQDSLNALAAATRAPGGTTNIADAMRSNRAGAIAIGASGTTSGADAIMIMLTIELRKELATAKEMRASPHTATRLRGYLATVSAAARAGLKSLIYSRSWSL